MKGIYRPFEVRIIHRPFESCVAKFVRTVKFWEIVDFEW